VSMKLGSWYVNCTARMCTAGLVVKLEAEVSVTDVRPASTRAVAAAAAAAAAAGRCYDNRDVVTTYGRMLLHSVGVCCCSR